MGIGGTTSRQQYFRISNQGIIFLHNQKNTKKANLLSAFAIGISLIAMVVSAIGVYKQDNSYSETTSGSKESNSESSTGIDSATNIVPIDSTKEKVILPADTVNQLK